VFSNRPLYQALNKYESNQFEVYEELLVKGKDLARFNILEGEYITKYNTLKPTGYNIEEIGKKYGKILVELAKHHDFEVERQQYIDKTRDNRCRDICFGKRFGLSSTNFSQETMITTLKTIEIDSIRLMESNGLRLIVRETEKRDNIRLYFTGSNDECLEFAKKISDNVIISESFLGKDCYKYQSKLDKLLENCVNLYKVSGKVYANKSNNTHTYLLVFYEKKNNKNNQLMRISFGGKSRSIQDSLEDAMKFIEKFKSQTTIIPEYIIQNRLESPKINATVCNREREKPCYSLVQEIGQDAL
jgi:hypothetical protein